MRRNKRRCRTSLTVRGHAALQHKSRLSINPASKASSARLNNNVGAPRFPHLTRDAKVPPTFPSSEISCPPVVRTRPLASFPDLICLLPPHDVDGHNATLMAGEKIIDEIADDGVRLVAEFRYNSADERAAARVPLQINGAVKVARAVDLRPAMRSAGLFRPDCDEPEFPFQLRIGHDLVPQRSAPGRDDLNHRLHP